MKTIILPTDFTDNAARAVQYAAHFAGATGADKIILYSTYSAPPTPTTDMAFSFVETDSLKQMSDDQLAKSREELKALVPPSVVIEVRSDYGFVENRISDLVKETDADLIIISIEKMGALEEVLTGSDAVSVIEHVQIPVLMVPPDAQWLPIRSIAWACDYKTLDKAPVWSLKPLLNATGATLHVIHNEPQPQENSYAKEQQQIREWFADVPVNFAELHQPDLREAVNHYVTENRIDLLIAIRRKHSWFEGLFTSSHSKQLAFEAHVPVVCVQGV